MLRSGLIREIITFFCIIWCSEPISNGYVSEIIDLFCYAPTQVHTCTQDPTRWRARPRVLDWGMADKVLEDGPEKIWHQFPRERNGQYDLFREYLAQPPGRRDMNLVAKAAGLAHGTVRNYSKGQDGRPKWAERARAWDYDQMEKVDENLVESKAEIIREHARLWSMVRKTAMKTIQSLVERGEELTADQALKYAELATKNERLAVGELTSKAGVNFSKASDGFLAQLEAELDKAEGKIHEVG